MSFKLKMERIAKVRSPLLWLDGINAVQKKRRALATEGHAARARRAVHVMY